MYLPLYIAGGGGGGVTFELKHCYSFACEQALQLGIPLRLASLAVIRELAPGLARRLVATVATLLSDKDK